MEKGRQSVLTRVPDGVSMVTSDSYQKIEAPSVSLHSTLPAPKTHSSPTSAHNFISALYSKVISVARVSNLSVMNIVSGREERP